MGIEKSLLISLQKLIIKRFENIPYAPILEDWIKVISIRLKAIVS